MAVQEIAVIGAGAMGHGIAQVAAQAGFEVALTDLTEVLLNRASGRIEANLRKGVELGKVTEAAMREALSRIRTTPSLEDAADTADLVIEAVVEELEVKREVLAHLDRVCEPAAIFASNTSSLSIASLAAATARADRVIGMHFFNPVHIMKLVEIVVSLDTSAETVSEVLEAARRMGKDAITVKDVPGFATSRLGVALGLEAIRMLEQGVASAEDIDKAMALGYNHPMGPLRLTDLVGLDIRLNIAEYLLGELGSEVFRPPKLLKRMVAEGKLGRKSGEGFYKWES